MLVRLADTAAKCGVFLCATAIIAMMFHICGDVVARKFGYPFVGTAEIVSAYYMPVIIFFPLAAATLNDENIEVDLFTGGWGEFATTLLKLFANVLGMAVVALWFFGFLNRTIHSVEISERWIIGSGHLSVWQGKVAVVVAMVLLLLAFIVRAIHFARLTVGTARSAS